MSALESVANNKCILAEHSFRSFGTRPLVHFYEYQDLVPMFPEVFFFSLISLAHSNMITVG